MLTLRALMVLSLLPKFHDKVLKAFRRLRQRVGYYFRSPMPLRPGYPCFLTRLQPRVQIQRRRITVLALESSADDSCAAVVTSDRKVLSNVVMKQPPFGKENYQLGIHPYFAVEHHQLNMPVVIQRALLDASLSISEIDGIAYTRGPGMPGCLAVAANCARGISAASGIPMVGVHHMQAHALTPLLTCDDPPEFPYLTLLVSGGHTLIVVTYAPNKFKILATTIDSSAGQVIDGVARLLHLSWHDEAGDLIGAGAALERLANRIPFGDGALPAIPVIPRALPNTLSFSFSGPKGEVNRFLSKLPPEEVKGNEALRIAVARAFQNAVFGQIEEKIELALKWCDTNAIHVSSLVVSGGVASNETLRSRLIELLKARTASSIPLICPPPHLCTDNAAMIGWASMYRFLTKEYDDFGTGLRQTWPLEEL